MLAMLRTPGGASWWNHAQNMLGFEISEHINGHLKCIPTETPNWLDFSPTYRLRLAELNAEA